MALASMSRREFAALVGVSSTLIQRLVARGLLPLDGGGKLPMPETLHAYLQVRAIQPKAVPPAGGAAELEPLEADDEGEDADGADAADGGDAAATGVAGRHRTPEEARAIAAAELRLKQWRAKLTQQRYEREAGELIARAEVAADARAVCTEIRNTLLALPARVASIIEAAIAADEDGKLRAGRIQRLIEDEVNSALEALYKSRFARGGA